jgi:orsellinic acid C2-O-methyltransferase
MARGDCQSRNQAAVTEQVQERDRAGDATQLVNLVNCGILSQAACVAAEMGIPDLLADGPKSPHELAQATLSHEPSLRRLLRALAALDLCTEREDGSFALTNLGSTLCTGGPHSLRSWTILCGRHLWPLYTHLLHGVRTGTRSHSRISTKLVFERLEHDAEASQVFNGAMAELSRLVAADLVRLHDFSRCRLIVDVGGGHGHLLTSILQAYPEAHGLLLDLPHAIAGAVERIDKHGLQARCRALACDFFQSVAPDGDAYLLKAILHDWDDKDCIALLRNCRKAIKPDGSLIVVERVMPDRMQPCAMHRSIARMDLTMMLGFGGHERTESEFRALLKQADLNLSKISATAFEFSVLEARPL